MTNPQNKLSLIFQNYARSLPSKVEAIEEFLGKIQNHGTEQEWEEFHRMIHSLCGSSGTYGFIDLSKELRQLEIFVKGLLQRKASEEDFKRIEELLNNVKKVLSVPPQIPQHFKGEPQRREGKL